MIIAEALGPRHGDFSPWTSDLEVDSASVVFGARDFLTPLAVMVGRLQRGGACFDLNKLVLTGGEAEAKVLPFLLEAAASYAERLGAEALVYRYTADASNDATRALLESLGFDAPVMTDQIVKTKTYAHLGPLLRKTRVPEGYRIAVWDELLPVQLEALWDRHQPEGFEYPDLFPLSGRGQCHGLDAQNSVALLCGAAIVGWMRCIRARPDTLVYRAVYIGPEHRDGLTSIGYAMVREALRIHIARKEEIPFAVIATPCADKGQNRLMERYLKKDAIYVRGKYEARKTLRAA